MSDDAICQARRWFAEELRFINSYYFRARLQFLHDFRRLQDVVGRNAQSRVRHDFVGRISDINRRFEYLHALPGKFCSAQPANKFLALS